MIRSKPSMTIFSDLSFCQSLSANASDASKTVGSFNITRACRGVLVLDLFTSHSSRLLPSKIDIPGGGTVRLINVYIPRRYNNESRSCSYTESSPRPDVANSHKPGG